MGRGRVSRAQRLVVRAAVLMLLAGAMAAVHPARGGGPTYVHGTASGEWWPEGSPYIVTMETVIPAGEQLTVHPGVEVRFADGTSLTAMGGLFAIGTDTSPVVFTSNATAPAPGDWWGILLEGVRDHTMRWVVVEYAVHGVSAKAGAHGTLADSRVESCQNAGVAVSFAAMTLDRVEVRHCGAGVSAAESVVGVSDSLLEGNIEAGILAASSGVEVSGTALVGNGAGAVLQASTMTLENSTVTGSPLALSLGEASTATAVSSPVDGEVAFLDAFSETAVYWYLTVTVVDLYGTGVPGAAVHVADNANGTQQRALTTGAGGRTDDVMLLARSMDLGGGMDYSPFSVEATYGEASAQGLVRLGGDTVVTMTLAIDRTPPVVRFPAPMVEADEDVAVTLDGTLTVDGDPQFPQGAAFRWSFVDGGNQVVLDGAAVSYVFATPGEYGVTLAVTDASGNSDSGLLVVRIRDGTPPGAEAGEDVVVRAGEDVTLDASASTDNDPAFPRGAQYLWAFEDGEAVTLEGVSPTYAFTRAGRYLITLTVEDAAGNAGTDQVLVTVRDVEGFPLAPAVAAGAALLAVAALSSTEVGKFGLLKLLFVPLYVRLRKKEVLDHFIRGQIYGYIRVHPGDTYTDIKRNLRVKNGTLTYHLDVLLREGLIKSRTSGANRLFYPSDSKMPEDGMALHAVQKMILERVEESPGISATDLAGLVGVSRQLVNYHVRPLVAKGLLRVERQGVRNRFYPPGSS